MAHRRRRNGRQKMSLLSGGGSLGSTVTNIATGLTPALTFVAAITAGDQEALDSQTSTVGRLKTMLNIMTGHTTGFNLFGDVPKFKAKQNPAGVFNPYTMAAIGGTVAGTVMKVVGKKLGIPKVASGGSRVQRIAASAIVPAMIGGYFDDAAPSKKVAQNPGYWNEQPAASPSMAANNINTSSQFAVTPFAGSDY